MISPTNGILYILSRMKIEDVKDKYKFLHLDFNKEFKKEYDILDFEVGFETNV